MRTVWWEVANVDPRARLRTSAAASFFFHLGQGDVRDSAVEVDVILSQGILVSG